MGEATNNLDDWLRRVQNARSRDEVFEILRTFKDLDWTDEQRAVMAHAYMRILENMKDTPQDKKSQTQEQQAADGPVWYEKM